MAKKNNLPDYLFEVSWEVCNKIGSIHTVLATKSFTLSKLLGSKHILIGPDIWMDTAQNPEFQEDPIAFRTWRMNAAEQGLRVRVGRWPMAGNALVILVDFSQYITRKNEILTELWEKYQLDSLSGQWDFVESALFGYAAGKVIESFVRFNVQRKNSVVAQFHDWESGAGVLTLKGSELNIATVFTTHDTVVGRTLACEGVDIYDALETLDADDQARAYNVVSKHSLEKCAAQNADFFTTVSSLAAMECRQFLDREPDAITPNGSDKCAVPKEVEQDTKKSRELLTKVAESMSGVKYDAPLHIAIGGRYEYKNKGYDLFLDSLAMLRDSGYSGRPIIAWILVTANTNGPQKKLKGCNTTHVLADYDTDTIFQKMESLHFGNSAEDKIHVFYVPAQLNGADGVFNKLYYTLLGGMDLTVFPSYYEPWGYAPLESVLFGVPTVTTSISGFGCWLNENYGVRHPAVTIVPRDDQNYEEAVTMVAETIETAASDTKKTIEAKIKDCASISGKVHWENLITNYTEIYSKAIAKMEKEGRAFSEASEEQNAPKIEINKPTWNSLTIARVLPKRLEYLDIISKNLWWCWNQEAIDLFEQINPTLWNTVRKNPIALLDLLTLEDYKKLESDERFLHRLDNVTDDFKSYMAEKKDRKSPSIAYFCMEYGLDPSLKIYSGGLGILAGDYLKESSDMKVNMTGIGLLYRYGYFNQKLTAQGDQVSDYVPQDFQKIPATPVRDKDNKWVTVSVAFPGRLVYARLWRVDVGRTELYLMDTDFEDNLAEDRQITYNLYGGDWENRLKQELLLGIGGIRALRALGIHADIYHCNEGHAAFTGIERLREYVEQNLSFNEALELVRASSLFTTHTPVPAGHDAFEEDMLRTYLSHIPEKLKTTWNTMLGLGKINVHDHSEKFSMSFLASNISQEVNGVSWLHGKVSQDILAGLWPGYLPEELHVGYVTNGVHYPTWTAPQWKEIHASVFGEEFKTHHYDKKCFEGIYNIDDAEIWKVRSELRKKLIKAVKTIISDPDASNHYSPQEQVEIVDTLRDDVLTIGFARRFATYKRAHLLFRDLDRLNEIVNNPEHPVQFLYAGKAHPADKAGQDLIKRIVEVSKMPQFIGKIVFVPNYDINLAKLLVQGVDIWMNTPTRPLEASGTSGEKAVMNGVMHFSVLDGWWVEGYQKDAGWALKMERTYDDQNFQDELDAATIYNIIEDDIAVKFYKAEGKDEIPHQWVGIIKNTIAKVACNFTTNRMLTDYIEKYYEPLYKRSKKLLADDCAQAREIAFWKKTMRRGWSQVEVVSATRPGDAEKPMTLGVNAHAECDVFVGDLKPEYIGVEVVYSKQDEKDGYEPCSLVEFKFKSIKNGIAKYVCDFMPNTTGAFRAAVRIFAKNDMLPHRQDFELVRWL